MLPVERDRPMAEPLEQAELKSPVEPHTHIASARSEPGVEAFVLYNDNETAIAGIVDALMQRNVSTYYFRRDVPVGAEMEAVEQERLASSATVVIALGDHGWGPNQLRLASQARALEKAILPVLIGKPSERDLDQLDGLFRKLRYLDLRHFSPPSFDELANAIRQARPVHDDQIERILRVIIDGSEEQRLEALERIRKSEA